MNWAKVIKNIGQILIYALLAWFIYSKLNGDLQSLLEYNIHSYSLLILSIILYAPTTLINGFNWHRLMFLSSPVKLDLMGQIDVYLRSFLLRYIPGNVVGILSRGTFNKKYGISMVHSLWGWFLENILYLFIGIILGSYILIKNVAEITPLIDVSSRQSILFLSITLFLIISSLLLAIVSIAKLDFLEKIFKKFLLPRIPNYKNSSYKEFSLTTKSRFEMLLRYAFVWIFPSVSFLLTVYAVTGGALERPIELISANALAWAVGYIVIITPSGGGVRELVLIQLLSSISGYSTADSIVITMASRVVSILGELLTIGSFYPIYLRKQNAKN